MEINSRHVVIVLGMHRSGTSAITRGLSVLGVCLGDNLYPPSFDNPKGFWEDRECLAINEELLAYLGSAYDRLIPDKGHIGIEKDEFINHLSVRASKHIAKMLDVNGSPWGFKDPRTCRLLWFWQPIIESCGCKISYMISLRNPISVARSLEERNRIPVERSYFLWLQHMLPAVIHTSGTERVVVDFDEILERPHEQVRRIASRIGLPFKRENELLLKEYVDDFLDKELRHTRFFLSDVSQDKNIPRDVVRTYELLLSFARDEVSMDNPEVLSELNSLTDRLAAFTPAFDYINILEDECTNHLMIIAERDGQIASLNQAVTERDGQIASLNQAVAERDGQIVILKQAVTEHDRQIASLNLVVVGRDEQIGSLNQALVERDGQIESLNQTIADRREQIAILNQAVADRDGQIASLSQDITERDGKITAILTSRSWRFTKPLRFFSRNLIIRPYKFSRQILSKYAHWFWRHLPISNQRKQRIKSLLFNRLPFLFYRTQTYHIWKSLNSTIDISSAPNINVVSISAHNTSTDSEYVPLLKAPTLKNKPVKLICFYLPQFHPIPENNLWWGEGFTEWTNVLPAQPQFVGHYQPHVPDELGCYSLLDPAVQRRQIELAKLYGIEGFCFYFYWFGGKRLLETPLQNYLNDNSLDFPFCLCWANENWTRRWDGLDSEVLIAQKHSSEDDLAFIQHVAQYMRDSRYIRIDGKPLLLVYRPSLLPSAKDTAKRWRNWCRDNGIGEIYLAYTQSFETVDPAKYGFDAAIEFPPNNSAPTNITDSVIPLSEDFGCAVYDWRYFVERSEKYKRPRYKLFRSVCPSWDNTARRKNHSTVFLNSSPALYQCWLENAIQDTIKNQANPDERLIFINAWNEWAEGAHLEPDRRYGYGYLKSTADALIETSKSQKIIYVSHDAHFHGAQVLSLNIVKFLKDKFHYKVYIVCISGGVLISDFKKYGDVYNLEECCKNKEEIKELITKLKDQGAQIAICNTVISGDILELLNEQKIKTVSLIHELPGIIKQYDAEEKAKKIARLADKIVFPSNYVKEKFEQFALLDPKKVVVRPQGMFRTNKFKSRKESARLKLNQELNVPMDAKIVLGVGYADRRKGIDIFVDVATKVKNNRKDTYFLWVGARDEEFVKDIDKDNMKNIIFIPPTKDLDAYYAAADLFLLSSREDPFPCVVLESMDVGVPVIGFKDAGGFKDIVTEETGLLVDCGNVQCMTEGLLLLLDNEKRLVEFSERSIELIEKGYRFSDYIYDILKGLDIYFGKVSVIVPNYNYEKYLSIRLESIISQAYPIYEIILLDDHSMDKSMDIANIYSDIAEQKSIDFKIIINEENSGSAFKQWMKGICNAKGDYIWIAEADDFSDAHFLQEVMKPFEEEKDISLSFVQSRQIDEEGNILQDNYIEYTSDINLTKWKRDYVRDGILEIIDTLAVKNSIPNVSGVVFKKYDINEISESLVEYNVAGDWFFYVWLLRKGKIAYRSASLNYHRRHKRSVTTAENKINHYKEVVKVQEYIMKNFTIRDEVLYKINQYRKYLQEYLGIRIKN